MEKVEIRKKEGFSDQCVFTTWGEVEDIDGNKCVIKNNEEVFSREFIENEAKKWASRLEMINQEEQSGLKDPIS